MNWVFIVLMILTHALAFLGGLVAMADTKMKQHYFHVSKAPPPPPPVPESLMCKEEKMNA